MSPTGTKPRVFFISHTPAEPRDTERAHKLAGELEALGGEVYIAPENIPQGEEWDPKLVGEILQRCTHFVVILSTASANSEWVRREIELAKRQREADTSFHIGTYRVERRDAVNLPDELADFLEEVAWEVVFPCPHCGHEVAINYNLAGEIVPCPQCGKHFQMPIPRGQKVSYARGRRVSSGRYNFWDGLATRLTYAVLSLAFWWLWYYVIHGDDTPTWQPPEWGISVLQRVVPFTWWCCGAGILLEMLAAFILGSIIFPWGASFYITMFVSPILTVLRRHSNPRLIVQMTIIDFVFMRIIYVFSIYVIYSEQIFRDVYMPGASAEDKGFLGWWYVGPLAAVSQWYCGFVLYSLYSSNSPLWMLQFWKQFRLHKVERPRDSKN